MPADADDADYSSIRSISVRFLQHANSAYKAAHHKLDTAYGELIYEIDALFNNNRTQVVSKSAVPNIVAQILISSMLGDDSPQAPRLREFISSSAITLKWHLYGPDNQSRLIYFKEALDDAIQNNQSSIRLVININNLHFKDNFAPGDLQSMSLTPFDDAPTTPAAGTAQVFTTPEQVSQAVTQAIQNLVSPSTLPLRTPIGGGIQTQQTGTIINPNSLPPVVRSRYEQCLQHDAFLTKHDRKPYELPDSTGTIRQSMHFMDGPNRLINRSGDVYYFSKWDEKQQKTFISRCPEPASKTHDASTIREWYYQFHAHAKAYGIYAHNYFDFRRLSGDPKGFTCGDGQDHDVPLLLDSKLRLWSSVIHAALQDVFSSTGTEQYRIVHRQHGKGYESLFDIIRQHHPEHALYPALLIKDRPSQKDKQTIADFHNEYLNYLKLRAYISGTAVNLNDPGEKELFFGSLKRGEDLLSATYDERNSNDPVKQSMYTQGNLVATLEAAYKRLTPRASPQLTSPIPKLRYSSTSS